MAERSDVRPGEVATELPASHDAGVYFIGRVRTPFKSRAECPRNTAESDADGRFSLSGLAPGTYRITYFDCECYNYSSIAGCRLCSAHVISR